MHEGLEFIEPFSALASYEKPAVGTWHIRTIIYLVCGSCHVQDNIFFFLLSFRITCSMHWEQRGCIRWVLNKKCYHIVLSRFKELHFFFFLWPKNVCFVSSNNTILVNTSHFDTEIGNYIRCLILLSGSPLPPLPSPLLVHNLNSLIFALHWWESPRLTFSHAGMVSIFSVPLGLHI